MTGRRCCWAAACPQETAGTPSGPSCLGSGTLVSDRLGVGRLLNLGPRSNLGFGQVAQRRRWWLGNGVGEFTTWLRESVKEFQGNLDRAEDAARELTERLGLLRRLGEFGNEYEDADDAFYQFRAKVGVWNV